MSPAGSLARFLGDARAVVRSDERLILLFLLLLSVAALAVFLYYTDLILDGLPDVLPTASPRP
ncbi:hypothetical protein U4E84_01495 [Halorubrum sp. AD140]|uniref:hypothetical protein n=1 Tax=Halorubrum sp. AD140 TaxID=3050073 RepID=UPI002ACD0177|nr:hypothetical protein [Halorubrum sp. AD140]MDZ5810029.1 hypothetical protein [Halorubrum sp. AD140]